MDLGIPMFQDIALHVFLVVSDNLCLGVAATQATLSDSITCFMVLCCAMRGAHVAQGAACICKFHSFS